MLRGNTQECQWDLLLRAAAACPSARSTCRGMPSAAGKAGIPGVMRRWEHPGPATTFWHSKLARMCSGLTAAGVIRARLRFVPCTAEGPKPHPPRTCAC